MTDSHLRVAPHVFMAIAIPGFLIPDLQIPDLLIPDLVIQIS